MQLRTRKEKKFDEVEADLPGVTLQQTQRFSIDALRSRLSGLSRFNPFSKAIARGDIVWLLDNTAFRPSRMGSWQAEFVTAVFEQEPKHKMVDLVAGIARTLGLADDAEEKRTIEERLGPFVWDIQVARAVVVMQAGSRKQLKLGATGTGGCSSDVVKISGHSKGSFIKANAVVTGGVSGLLEMQTFYAGPDGWAIISGKTPRQYFVFLYHRIMTNLLTNAFSDIDDTIKITTTSDPVGILRETFINQPRPIPGMPELYADLKSYLPKDSPWFYLSASPYNLYPFLREFRDRHYPPGTMILRDSNWMTIAGLLSALTMGTEEYKVDRMKKVNTWFPKKKLIVFGDSTQSDPEAYGEM